MKKQFILFLFISLIFAVDSNFSSLQDFIFSMDKEANYFFIPAILVALDFALLSLMSNRKAGIFTSAVLLIFFSFGILILHDSPYITPLIIIFVLQAVGGIFLHSREVFM